MSVVRRVITRKQLEALGEISKSIVVLTSEGVEDEALQLAKVAVDLTNGNGLLRVSPTGVSVGDRVKSNVVIKKKTSIPRSTPGNVVGYDEEAKQFLVLFFPVWLPQGVLVLVPEKDLIFVSKPKIEENTEQVLNPPRSAIVQAFSDEILAKSGLETSGSWVVSRGKDDTEWVASSVIRMSGVAIPRGNKEAAGEIVREVATTLKQSVADRIRRSDLSAFVELVDVTAQVVKIDHKHLPSYPLLKITYKAV
jgi:hypothetical protein